jgi:S1-C subfamily serine protease
VISVVALAVGAGGDHTTRVVERRPEIVSSRAGVLDARAIYRRDAPGVAYVQSSGITTNTPFGKERETATGSGFVLDRRGDILTNAHVVDGAGRSRFASATPAARSPRRSWARTIRRTWPSCG